MSDKLPNKNISGIVENKTPSTSEHPKAPAGYFFIDKKKITIWDKESFDEINEGDDLSFLCSASENKYQGKTYVNYNVISGEVTAPLEKSDLEIDGVAVLIDDKVEDIHMTIKTIEFLKEHL